MKTLRVYTVNGSWYYAVYNMQGDLALWTTSRSLAEQYAASFLRHPHCTEITVGRALEGRPKRL